MKWVRRRRTADGGGGYRERVSSWRNASGHEEKVWDDGARVLLFAQSNGRVGSPDEIKRETL